MVRQAHHERIKSINNKFVRTNLSTSSGRTAYLIGVSLALCGLFLLSACDREEAPPGTVLPVVQGASVRIGVVPALTVTATIRQYQPVVDYLNKKLNINSQLMPQKDYLTVLEKMQRGELDAGIFGSLLGYRAIREIGALPLARPESHGDSTYEGLVFARKDSGIKDIDGLKGKVFAYVDMNTSAGYVYPRALLKEKGYDADRFFKEAIFAGKHDAGVLMVLNITADGGTTKDDVYYRLAKDDPRIERELRILHLSAAEFPDRTVAARKGFDPVLAEQLKQALIGMDKNEEGLSALKAAGFDRYIATGAENFRQLENMLR
jgi:phosphonate transport system substrate-binding protein